MLAQWISGLPGVVLFLLIALCLLVLAKAADWLVDEAVDLSQRSGIPKVVIGATIVSLGTTSPEAVVSVLAALQGKPSLALGNAVGSVICDTGLILGLASFVGPLRLDRSIVNRQGWLQLGAGFLLVTACLPWSNLTLAWTEGGRLDRATGWFFLLLLALYLWATVKWAGKTAPTPGEALDEKSVPDSTAVIVAKLGAALLLVLASCWTLIPAVSEAAFRLGVPDAIIAATLVAFGTSLPELVTALSAARRGHGELAVGNVIGADILNVLFVAGAAAAVTKGGLEAPPPFFRLYFPSMLFILIVFRIGSLTAKEHLGRAFGALLLAVYVLVTVLSYS